MVKTTGAEWKKFYNDEEFWQYDWWHEDEEITINGVSVDSCVIDLHAVADTDVIGIAYGVVYKGSMGVDAPSLESHFKAWRKKQTMIMLVIEVSKDRLDAVQTAIRAAGGRVVK